MTVNNNKTKNNIFIVQSFARVDSFCAPRLPNKGETLIAYEYFTTGGGKGLNQAEAAKFFDVNVEVIGRVGNDDMGLLNKEICEKSGIGSKYLVLDDMAPTGKCSVFRSSCGENSIMVYPGAASNFSIEDFKRAEDYIKTCKIGGFQFEVNVDAVCESIICADQWGVRTFLDPAPVPEKLDESIYRHLSFIKPNEHEAYLLTGIVVDDLESARKAGEWFLNKGLKEAALITLGDKGAVFVSKNEVRFYSTPKVVPKDSSAAGDCFAGAFIAAIADGKDYDYSVRQATCMAALKVANRVGKICDLYADTYRRQFSDICREYGFYADIFEY